MVLKKLIRQLSESDLTLGSKIVRKKYSQKWIFYIEIKNFEECLDCTKENWLKIFSTSSLVLPKRLGINFLSILAMPDILVLAASRSWNMCGTFDVLQQIRRVDHFLEWFPPPPSPPPALLVW